MAARDMTDVKFDWNAFDHENFSQKLFGNRYQNIILKRFNCILGW